MDKEKVVVVTGSGVSISPELLKEIEKVAVVMEDVPVDTSSDREVILPGLDHRVIPKDVRKTNPFPNGPKPKRRKYRS